MFIKQTWDFIDPTAVVIADGTRRVATDGFDGFLPAPRIRVALLHSRVTRWMSLARPALVVDEFGRSEHELSRLQYSKPHRRGNRRPVRHQQSAAGKGRQPYFRIVLSRQVGDEKMLGI